MSRIRASGSIPKFQPKAVQEGTGLPPAGELTIQMYRYKSTVFAVLIEFLHQGSKCLLGQTGWDFSGSGSDWRFHPAFAHGFSQQNVFQDLCPGGIRSG